MAADYRAVIISPHLDDAVFSCGAEISRLRQEGPVLVLNLFSRFVGTVRKRGVVLGDMRQDEEVAAARFLDFETRSLHLLDASCRLPAYQSLGQIFLPPQPEDKAWLTELRHALFEVLSKINAESIFVPMGIGWHVDHILTHEVFGPWLGQRTDLIFYEDAPYCQFPHAARFRLHELSTDGPFAAAGRVPLLEIYRAWIALSRDYASTALMKKLEPAIIRIAAVPVVSIYLLRLLFRHRGQTPRGDAALYCWTSRVLQLEATSSSLSRKVDAMMLYQSQFEAFYFDRADCLMRLRQYAQQVGIEAAAIERFWTCDPPEVENLERPSHVAAQSRA